MQNGMRVSVILLVIISCSGNSLWLCSFSSHPLDYYYKVKWNVCHQSIKISLFQYTMHPLCVYLIFQNMRLIFRVVQDTTSAHHACLGENQIRVWLFLLQTKYKGTDIKSLWGCDYVKLECLWLAVTYLSTLCTNVINNLFNDKNFCISILFILYF